MRAIRLAWAGHAVFVRAIRLAWAGHAARIKHEYTGELGEEAGV